MISEFISTSVYIGVFISLAAYFLGVFIRKKINFPLFNPLLIAIVLTLVFLIVSHTSYDVYYEGASGKQLAFIVMSNMN